MASSGDIVSSAGVTRVHTSVCVTRSCGFVRLALGS